MELIKNRKQLSPLIPELMQEFERSQQDFLKALQSNILNNKIPFPLLEHLTTEMLKKIESSFHLPLAIEIMKLNGMGRYVICGQLLKQQLQKDHLGTLTTSLGFIRQGDEWRACDLIGERVIGNSFLMFPDQTLSLAAAIIQSPTKWDKRAIGVGIHYAVKKGLSKTFAEQSFQLLISLSREKDFHTKKGVGWAVKTISKFHPDLITKHENSLKEASQWFKTKVLIGKDLAALKGYTTQSPTLTSQA